MPKLTIFSATPTFPKFQTLEKLEAKTYTLEKLEVTFETSENPEKTF